MHGKVQSYRCWRNCAQDLHQSRGGLLERTFTGRTMMQSPHGMHAEVQNLISSDSCLSAAALPLPCSSVQDKRHAKMAQQGLANISTCTGVRGHPSKVRPHAQGVRIPPSAQCFGPKPCTQWTLAPLLPALTATQSPGGPGTPPWSVHTAQRPMPLALEPTLTYRASRDNTKTAIASATSRLPHGESHKLR